MLSYQWTARGFTLIELSIVLVIIGMLVGGILLGRDLIHAAELRTVVTQYDQIDTAVSVFRLKFNCLPGDCRTGSDFGFDAAADGNGDWDIGCKAEDTGFCIQLGSPSGFYNVQKTREYVNFWYHLAVAAFIPGSYAPFDPSDARQYASVVSPAVKLLATAPPSYLVGAPGRVGWAVRNSAYFLDAFGGGVPDDHQLRGHVLTLSDRAPDVSFEQGRLYSTDIAALDQKMDDGMPMSGRIVVWGLHDAGWYEVPPASGNTCVVSGVSFPVYNWKLTTSAGCSLLIKAGF